VAHDPPTLDTARDPGSRQMSTVGRPQRPRRRRVPVEEAAAAILAAALRVLEERGWEGLTIAAVAREADLSVGNVYLRFGDKDGLLLAMHDAFLTSLRERASAQPDPQGPLEERVAHLVREHCRLLSEREHLMRLFMTKTVLDPRLVDHASASTRVIAEHFEAALLESADEIARPDPRQAAMVCFRMVHDVAARRVARGSTFESDVELSWDRLSEELARVCVAYLRRPGAASA
jgi:AcrR family transcriptional regulator